MKTAIMMNYRNGNFMHLTAVDYGVYVFLVAMETALDTQAS